MKMFLLGMLVMYLGIFIVTLLVGFFTQICEDTFLEHIFMFPLLIIYWIIKIIVVPFLKILDNFKKWWYNNYRKTEREMVWMGMEKAIASGKEHRKPYYGTKAIDKTCRNGGSCEWCRRNRMYKNLQKLQESIDNYKE